MVLFLSVTLLLFVFGAVIGSFLNVVMYRSIVGESWVVGRSHCEHCQKKIAWYDNVPLLSYFLLRGQCRHCHTSISISHPVIEFLTATLFVWWYWGGSLFFHLTSNPFHYIQPIFWLLVGVILLIIFSADVLYMIIPDEAVIALTAMTLFYRIALTLTGVMQTGDFIRTLLGAVACSGFFFVLWWGTKGRGMGFGDVKFAFPFGLLLGWPNVLVGLFLSFIFGAIVSLVLVALQKKKIQQTVPFGPFLVAGTFVTLVWGNTLLHWYMGFLH